MEAEAWAAGRRMEAQSSFVIEAAEETLGRRSLRTGYRRCIRRQIRPRLSQTCRDCMRPKNGRGGVLLEML
jgi:hypothetical protein